MKLVMNTVLGVPSYEYRDATNVPVWSVKPGEETPEISDEFAAKLLKRTTAVLGGGRVHLFRLVGTEQPGVRQPTIRERLAAHFKKDLIKMAKSLDLDHRGKKEDLVERLAVAYEDEEAAKLANAALEDMDANPGAPIPADEVIADINATTVEQDAETDDETDRGGMAYSDLEEADED